MILLLLQLQDWFTQKGWKELKRKMEIADNVGKAEMLCNHFDTGIHSKAKVRVVFEGRGMWLIGLKSGNEVKVYNLGQR